MKLKNVEFKVKVSNTDQPEQRLKELNPVFKGEDHQTDTYFKVKHGRLKLREGNIENALIHYHRPNTAAAKQSDVILHTHHPDKALKEILTIHLGIMSVVKKRRRIYFVDNVKFHFDKVDGLGCFVEVEAIDSEGSLSTESLQRQCDYYFDYFGFDSQDLVDRSYGEMIFLQKTWL